LIRGQEFSSSARWRASRRVDEENERLRYASPRSSRKDHGPGSHFENEPGAGGEREALVQRYKQVEQENLDFANRYLEIEEENNNLANLYVASFQLHSTLDFKEVVQIVMEIVINLIGAEKFGLMLLDERKGDLYAVLQRGDRTRAIPHIKMGEGTIGRWRRPAPFAEGLAPRQSR
jgi:hypothetical protein